MMMHVFSIFISTINMLSIIILSFMYIKSNIRDTSEFSSDSIFVSSDCDFFFFLPFCNALQFFLFFYTWALRYRCDLYLHL